MPWSVDEKINSFAIRSFRETADKDYIVARMAYRARLIQQFQWAALHCLEKYVKGICLLNRIKAHRGHTVLAGLDKLKNEGKFSIELTPWTKKFINRLEEDGAEYRYYETSYDVEEFDVVRLDCAVWEIRRYCQPLDYSIKLDNGVMKDMLNVELDRVTTAMNNKEKGTCIKGGILEKIIETPTNPARKSLIWNNLYFGPSSRKIVKMKPDWEAGNSPLFLYPEIIDEVLKYVFIPKNIADGARELARQKAAEKEP